MADATIPTNGPGVGIDGPISHIQEPLATETDVFKHKMAELLTQSMYDYTITNQSKTHCTNSFSKLSTMSPTDIKMFFQNATEYIDNLYKTDLNTDDGLIKGGVIVAQMILPVAPAVTQIIVTAVQQKHSYIQYIRALFRPIIENILWFDSVLKNYNHQLQNQLTLTFHGNNTTWPTFPPSNGAL